VRLIVFEKQSSLLLRALMRPSREAEGQARSTRKIDRSDNRLDLRSFGSAIGLGSPYIRC